MRVLLVDESKTMRALEKSVLQQLGYTEIDEASDGQGALRLAGECAPDLLLVDWNLGDMEGQAFIERFQTQHQSTPIILITTESQSARVVDAVLAGVSDFIVKPFTPDLLSERINAAMGKMAA